MSEVQGHTPTPWRLDRLHGNDGGHDEFRLSAESTLFVHIEPCSDGYRPGETAYNAHLLWAAPDLLAACRALGGLDLSALDMDENHEIRVSDFPRLWKALAMAKAAVKKATTLVV